MKQILLSILMLVCVIGVKAQDAMVATLQSGEQSRVFYGANGFVEAVDAAKTGDLITLSAGTFNTTTIRKSLRIQGAGYLEDFEKGLYRTIFNADLYIELVGDDTDDFLLEGIYSSSNLYMRKSVLNRFVLKRCRFENVYFNESQTKDCQLEHCRIAGSLQIGGNATSFSVINSIVANLSGSTSTSSILYRNSIIHHFNSYYDAIVANFENCILNSRSSTYQRPYLHENCIVKNCLSFYNGMFDNVKSKEGFWYSTKEKVWGDDLNYGDTYSYELTDEAKSEYIDSEGKEIGIHGGFKPFTFTPSNPQITNRDIDTKTSGGKLKVNITVEAQND